MIETSGHLPECYVATPLVGSYGKRDWLCICDRLRACEQRVTSRFAEYLRHMVDDDKFGQGVQDARDAAAAEAKARHVDGPTMFLTLPQALAAIDALTDERGASPMPTDDGPYVLYADHLAAIAKAERISSKVIADFQRQARKAALREALAAVRGLIHSAQCDCESCFWLAPAPDAIQRLIDGGSE